MNSTPCKPDGCLSIGCEGGRYCFDSDGEELSPDRPKKLVVLPHSNCTDSCHYGVGPHVCFYKIPGATLGQSKAIEPEDWPDNYEPDPQASGLGVWHYCGWSRSASDKNNRP